MQPPPSAQRSDLVLLLPEAERRKGLSDPRRGLFASRCDPVPQFLVADIATSFARSSSFLVAFAVFFAFFAHVIL